MYLFLNEKRVSELGGGHYGLGLHYSGGLI